MGEKVQEILSELQEAEPSERVTFFPALSRLVQDQGRFFGEALALHKSTGEDNWLNDLQDIRLRDVAVQGDTARARMRSRGGMEPIHFLRTLERWLIIFDGMQ